MKLLLSFLLALSLGANIVLFDAYFKIKADSYYRRMVISADKIAIEVCKDIINNTKEEFVIQKPVIRIEKCITPIEEIRAVKEAAELEFEIKDNCDGYGEETYADCSLETKEGFNERREAPIKY